MALPKGEVLDLFVIVRSAAQDFPISLDKVWAWFYERKEAAIAHLQKNFSLDLDYRVSTEAYHLTEDALKALAACGDKDSAKPIRLYYMGLEKAHHSLSKPRSQLEKSHPMYDLVNKLMQNADAARAELNIAEERVQAAQTKCREADRVVRAATQDLLAAQSEAKRLGTIFQSRNKQREVIIQGCTAGTS
jgi:hypothetical protein